MSAPAAPVAGPADRDRTAPASFFDRLTHASRAHGITRLADVTGLDRLGLPVWQAIRPAGKSLSVHQGKGISHEAARVGALCEAIEAHCAEHAPADGPLRAFAALPEADRAPEFADYCRLRTEDADGSRQIQWCSATDLLSGRRCYLPHDLVSLDFTRNLPSDFERASSGLGAGPSERAALLTSLLELIERDAVGEWRRLDPAARAATAMDAERVPFAWFQAWRARLSSLEVALQVFGLASVIGVPTFLCVIGGCEEFGSAYRRFSGTAAHGDPEIALFRALAEAIQSRLTLIAGVRDDIMPAYYDRAQPKPIPGAGLSGSKVWTEAGQADLSPEDITAKLAELGYRQVAVKRLDCGLDGVAVTKAFVPGLGSSSRTRRIPR